MCQGPFHPGEEALLPVMLPQQACREPWKSLAVLVPGPLMRHPLLRTTEPAELGEDRNGRDGLPLVLSKHVPVFGYFINKEDMWGRSLGINDPGGQANFRKHLERSEGRNNTAYSPPQSSGPQGCSNVLGQEWLPKR